MNQHHATYQGGARLTAQSGLMSHIFRFQLDPFDGFVSDDAILIQNSPTLTEYSAGKSYGPRRA